MSTVATGYVHPALVAVRKTPEHAALLVEFQLAASQVYGGTVWRDRQQDAQAAMFRMERAAVDAWDVAQESEETHTAPIEGNDYCNEDSCCRAAHWTQS